MGLKHGMVYKYLKELEEGGHIIGHGCMAKKKRWKFLNPSSSLLPKEDEPWVKVDLRGAGKKDFDIFGHIEAAIQKQKHPIETIAQLTFRQHERTKRRRKARKRQFLRERTKTKPNVVNKPKSTPFGVFLKNTPHDFQSAGGGYNGLIYLDSVPIPWHKVKKTKHLSEHKRKWLRLRPDDFESVIRCGKVYFQVRVGVYESIQNAEVGHQKSQEFS